MATSTTATSDSDRVIAPYGYWKSPTAADVVSGASKKLGGTAVDGCGRLIWLESRPTKGGRGFLFLSRKIREVTLWMSLQRSLE